MMSVFRGVRDSRIGQLPRWSVEVLRDAQLQGLKMRFCRDGFGPAQVQVLAEKHSFGDFGKTTDPLRPISASAFKLASTSEYRCIPPSLTQETSRRNRQLKLPPCTMAALRSQSAARMLRSAAAPRVALAAAPRRFQSNVTQASGTITGPVTSEPDYTIQSDKATSYDSRLAIKY